MTYDEVINIGETCILPLVSRMYGLEGYQFNLIRPHDGGRNVIYQCEKEGADAKILRIAFLNDRRREDFLAELEYIRYLSEHGGSVANVICSRRGNLLEEIDAPPSTLYVSLFEKARGKLLVDNQYRYREGVPLTEYFYNCGKVLGKLHQLSKEYTPSHRRYHLLEKFNPAFIENLIPASLSRLKENLVDLLKILAGLDTSPETYGMIHFDYNDGNYCIDFDTGQITVFDFENSCFGWYMVDLVGVWRSGTGWIQFEPDAAKRKKFMEDYFETVLAGYRSETRLDPAMLEQFPLFLQVVLMENIVDEFVVMRANGEEPACDEALSYLIKCVEDDIPYLGFFSEMYASEDPFAYEERNI